MLGKVPSLSSSRSSGSVGLPLLFGILVDDCVEKDSNGCFGGLVLERFVTRVIPEDWMPKSLCICCESGCLYMIISSIVMHL